MSSKNGTGINPALLRDDRIISKKKTPKKTNETNNEWKIELPTKPEKITFTQVRISDPIITGLKDYIRREEIDIGYARIVNEVMTKFLENNGITVK